MKKLILILAVIFIYSSCSQAPKPLFINDGFYEVVKLGNDSTKINSLNTGQVIIKFDSLFNPDEVTKVAIDTTEYVPLELDSLPIAEQQTESKKLLSISLTPKSAEKLKTFTEKRVMKEVVVVLDGKAVTMHKIREALTGTKMQITRCGDNACEYLYVKMKDNVKK
jgi:hypothetical protein